MPLKAQATQLPTFGAFKKFETHMQNRLPSSTETSYREEERDSRVFLKACDEPASQLNPDRDKIFNFPENNFLQQISQRSSSSGLFAFGNTAEDAKPPDMHYRKVPCANPHCLLPDRDTITFSSKFCSAAARMAPSHLGALLKLRNLRKCIISKFLPSLHTAFWVLAETRHVPLIMRKLPV